MTTAYEPTTAELQDVWKRTGLWRGGHTFEKDIQVPVILLTLRNAVLASHKTHALPEQASLQLETA
jgi:hypothetical protein